MPSQLITSPDIVAGQNNILIINANREQLTTLVLWLKTQSESYNVYVWHQGMNDDLGWVQNVSDRSEVILVDKNSTVPQLLLNYFDTRVTWFGQDTEYQDLIHYFLKKQELEV